MSVALITMTISMLSLSFWNMRNLLSGRNPGSTLLA